jgi:thioredoxin-related protein
MMLRIVLTIGISLLGAFAVADPGVEKPEFSRPDSRSWVVMVTQPTCSFCTRLEKEILQPLRASGQFAGQVRFTTVDIGVAGPLVDFDGSRTTTTQFANRYQGFGTPTLLFLSPAGDVLAPPKFGVPDIIDFYAYEIEETIRGLPPVN